MKKNVFGRQFKRDTNERKALFKNLLTSLVMEEHIKTTQEKAKAIRGAADKLVTKAKKGGTHGYRLLAPDVNHNAVEKLMTDLAPRFASRQGGYTKMVKVGHRLSDNAAMVLMSWTDKPVVIAVEPIKEENKEKKKAEKASKKEAKTVKEVKEKKVTEKKEKKEKAK